MMKQSRLFTAGCIGCALLIASPSWAAMVQPGLGDLTINQGKGFRPATSRISANVGDSVMVGPGGSATVVYDDGCKVNVQPGAVTAIVSTPQQKMSSVCRPHFSNAADCKHISHEAEL
jgi:hypothetical protein